MLGDSKIKFGANGGGYMQIAIPRYYNRPISNQEIYRLFHSKKNMEIPSESSDWWLPCMIPQCWIGLNHIWPFELDIDIEADGLK